MSENFSLNRLLPNAITIFGLCSGVTSIKFAFLQQWEKSIIFLFIAFILDGFDGRVARFLGTNSIFGFHLDSLSDVVTSGVAPAFLIFNWYFFKIKFFGWGVIMLHISCIVIRLARFNSQKNTDQENNNYFLGLPSPLSGSFLILPVILDISSYDMVKSFFVANDYLLIVYSLIVDFLTISNIRVPSLKQIYIPKHFISVFLLIISIFTFSLFVMPWNIIPISLLTIFIYIFFYNVKFLNCKFFKKS